MIVISNVPNLTVSVPWYRVSMLCIVSVCYCANFSWSQQRKNEQIDSHFDTVSQSNVGAVVPIHGLFDVILCRVRDVWACQDALVSRSKVRCLTFSSVDLAQVFRTPNLHAFWLVWFARSWSTCLFHFFAVFRWSVAGIVVFVDQFSPFCHLPRRSLALHVYVCSVHRVSKTSHLWLAIILTNVNGFWHFWQKCYR